MKGMPAAANSPYANTPDSPQFLMLHQRMVAKLYGFVAPDMALQRYGEADRSLPARYARAIIDYRFGQPDAALRSIDALIGDDHGNDKKLQSIEEYAVESSINKVACSEAASMSKYSCNRFSDRSLTLNWQPLSQ